MKDEPKNVFKNGLNIIQGNKHWYKDDRMHREDGPAYIGADGFKTWSIHGKLHRLDGPAVITKESTRWCYEGKWIKEVSSQEEFEQWLKYKSFL